jgi:phosphonate metabolism protein PhnN/1,5-bisphosphokinase (PRPP-forming)
VSRGTLFLVVGPSGAGKDTLIRAVRAALDGDERVMFARRVVTRRGAHPTEDYETAGPDAFAARLAAGGFMLHWQAHGLEYGIPVVCAGALSRGTDVVANVSRAVVAEAAERFAPVCVIRVTAPAAVLAQRLRQRGREDPDAIAERLARIVPIPAGVRVVNIENTGTVADGARAFLAALGRGSGAVPPQTSGTVRP